MHSAPAAASVVFQGAHPYGAGPLGLTLGNMLHRTAFRGECRSHHDKSGPPPVPSLAALMSCFSLEISRASSRSVCVRERQKGAEGLSLQSTCVHTECKVLPHPSHIAHTVKLSGRRRIALWTPHQNITQLTCRVCTSRCVAYVSPRAAAKATAHDTLSCERVWAKSSCSRTTNRAPYLRNDCQVESAKRTARDLKLNTFLQKLGAGLYDMVPAVYIIGANHADRQLCFGECDTVRCMHSGFRHQVQPLLYVPKCFPGRALTPQSMDPR